MNVTYTSRIKAFTLIELLIVIGIIGLLSSVVLVALSRARNSTQDSARVQALVQVRSALAIYASNNNLQYPLGSAYSTVESLVGLSSAQGPLYPYLKSLPANLSSVAQSKYASDGVHYELLVTTQNGGQFAKNNSCDSSDYATYNNGLTSLTYCIGNSPTAALIAVGPATVSCSVSPNQIAAGATGSFIFTASASNFSPISYVWIVKGQNYPTSSNPYTINSLSFYPSATWHVYVVASDASGNSLTSSDCPITVN